VTEPNASTSDESPTEEHRSELLRRVESRNRDIRTFLSSKRPHRNRLSLVCIITSALAAAMTAGPATGGTKFTSAAQGALNLADSSVVWRVLCGVAFLVSLVSAIAANLNKSSDLPTKLSVAESCAGDLEALENALRFGTASTADGVDRYEKIVSRIPFVDRAAA
jgi:hypothetical protein